MVLRSITIFFVLFTSMFSYSSELKSVTAQEYIKQNPSLEREKIINFLVSQFKGKKANGVSQKMLDEIWNNKELKEKYMLARFQIIGQRLYADSYFIGHYYFPVFLRYFEKLIKNYKIPDVDFILFLREEIPESEEMGKLTMGVPSFIMFQDKQSKYELDKLLFPDGFFIKENKNGNWGNLLKKIEEANKKNSWESKQNKVFWRGITTGDFNDYTVENFAKLPRMTLSVFAKLYPDLIDASFSGYSPQVPYNSKEHSLREFCKILFGRNPKGANEAEHLKYKYLISVDGNSATGTRVSWIMNSNSVLVKQETDKIQWYYSALEAYKNYIPVNKRLTDIFDQIKWMKANDDKVKTISQNAQNFIRNEMQPENIDAHVLILLDEYSKIQKDIEIIPTLKPADQVITITSVFNMLWFKFKLYLKNRTKEWL